MNVLHNIERLRALSEEIDALESTMLEHERSATDLTGSEEECEHAGDKAAASRMLLVSKLAEHFVLSRNILTVLWTREERRAA